MRRSTASNASSRPWRRSQAGERSRLAAGALYHATTAALLAWEGTTLGARGGDARRLLLSRMVVEHRLMPQDPLSLSESDWEMEAMDFLLSDDRCR